MLILIHREDCHYSAKVRQFMSDNNVSYISLVSQKGSPSREILRKLGGQEQVPFLIDTDTGTMMYESADIINYVGEHYVR